MTKHRMHGTREYKSWLRIKTICYNKANPSYKAYGGRGIRMDKNWFESFNEFYKDMGDCPEGCTGIELINMDADFTKINCRWVSPKNRRKLKDMPNQKNRQTNKLYNAPKRIVLTFEKPYFEFIQRQAIERSRQLKRPISAIDMIKELIEENFPIPRQLDMFNKENKK